MSNENEPFGAAHNKHHNANNGVKAGGELNGRKSAGKINSLFEIQNTLDDTCVLVENENKNGDDDAAVRIGFFSPNFISISFQIIQIKSQIN